MSIRRAGERASATVQSPISASVPSGTTDDDPTQSNHQRSSSLGAHKGLPYKGEAVSTAQCSLLIAMWAQG